MNVGYISNIVENIVNNEQLNSNDPNVMTAKIVNLFLQQSQAINNPFKIPPITTIRAEGLKIEEKGNTYRIYNYTFSIKPGKYLMMIKVRGIESHRTKAFIVGASLFSVYIILN